ncbi:hypothetical protein MKX01_027094, partial [Papaver californicum]
EKNARIEYTKIHNGKQFKNAKVYQIFKSHISRFNPEEYDQTQPQESESESPSGDASSIVQASMESSINDGCDRILKHFSEDNDRSLQDWILKK